MKAFYQTGMCVGGGFAAVALLPPFGPPALAVVGAALLVFGAVGYALECALDFDDQWRRNRWTNATK